MKTAIVIGALGFIGFPLCSQLLESGYEVIGIDGYKDDPFQKKIQEQKYLEIARNSNFTLLESNIKDTKFEVLQTSAVVYYCVNSEHVDQDNITAIKEQGINNLAKVTQYCKRVKAKLIYLSSYEVYKEDLATIDHQTKLEPRNFTGEVKVNEEKAILKSEGVNYHIVRIPTVYGPWQPENMTYQQLIAATNIETIDPICEDVVYIYDLVQALIAVYEGSLEKKISIVYSGKEQQWLEGYNQLVADERKLKTPPATTKVELVKDDQWLNKYIKTDIKTGINEQKNHYLYIQKLIGLDLI